MGGIILLNWIENYWRLSASLFLLLTVTGCGAPPAAPPRVRLERVAEGFAAPVFLTAPEGDPGVFVVDQVGVIWRIEPGADRAEAFLDLRDRLVTLSPTYDERGLLGLAFHPDYAENDRLYVYYSAPPRAGGWDHTSVIAEYRAAVGGSPMEIDSEWVLLAVDKPGYNYEGGHLAFGPDGMLYVSMGDSARDPSTEIGGYAPDWDSPLGKILRIDPDSGAWEVYAAGFRNPYRFSFDAEHGLIAADVGHAVMEEIDVVEPGGQYGWPIREGTTCFNAEGWTEPLGECAASVDGEPLIDPVAGLAHADGYSALIGGYVYRGDAIPALVGWYVFGDWGRGEGRLLAARPGAWQVMLLDIVLPDGYPGLGQVLGIGRDAVGELYVLTNDPRGGPRGHGGEVWRIEAIGSQD